MELQSFLQSTLIPKKIPIIKSQIMGVNKQMKQNIAILKTIKNQNI